MPRKPNKPADPVRELSGELEQAQRFLPLEENDPVAYLEIRRLEYVKRIEKIANDAHDMSVRGVLGWKAARELELKALAFLTRLTSVWKTKVDVSVSTQLGLVRAPNLKDASAEELKMLESGDAGALERFGRDDDEGVVQ